MQALVFVLVRLRHSLRYSRHLRLHLSLSLTRVMLKLQALDFDSNQGDDYDYVKD